MRAKPQNNIMIYWRSFGCTVILGGSIGNTISTIHYLYDKVGLDVYIDFILGTEKKI